MQGKGDFVVVTGPGFESQRRVVGHDTAARNDDCAAGLQTAVDLFENVSEMR